MSRRVCIVQLHTTRRSAVLCLLFFSLPPFSFSFSFSLPSSLVLIFYHVLLGPSEPDRSGPDRLAPRHCCLVDATTGHSFNCKAYSYCLPRRRLLFSRYYCLHYYTPIISIIIPLCITTTTPPTCRRPAPRHPTPWPLTSPNAPVLHGRPGARPEALR